MAKLSKRTQELKKLVAEKEEFTLLEGVETLKKLGTAKFDETIDVAVNLGVDPKHADQMIRGSMVLPHGNGKEVKVLVFAKGELETQAKEAGADFVGAEDLIAKIKDGFLDFDKAVAAPDCMALVGRIGKILGPRGLMPNPKLGTVTKEVGKVVKELKSGRIEYRTDKHGIIHCGLGKASFSPEQLKDNLITLLQALNRAKPASAKGIYMQKVSLSSTMSPSVNLDLGDVQETLRALA